AGPSGRCGGRSLRSIDGSRLWERWRLGSALGFFRRFACHHIGNVTRAFRKLRLSWTQRALDLQRERNIVVQPLHLHIEQAIAIEAESDLEFPEATFFWLRQ